MAKAISRFGLVWVFVAGTLLPPATAKANAKDHSSRDILLLAVSEADKIEDEKIRAAAQWNLVRPLIKSGQNEKAYAQAMKLQHSNPHTCILSLSAIALEDKSEDSANRERAVQSAIEVNQQAKFNYTHNVIDLLFKLKRHPDEAIRVADGAPPNRRSRAFGDVRDWLARTGRVDEAYAVARKYLGDQPEIHHHRKIGFSCASVKHYDYHATHDYFSQTIDVIKKMPNGKERDFVIGQLVSNLTYVVGDDEVSDKHLKLASYWAEQIQNEEGRGAARRSIVKKKTPGTIEEMKKQFATATLREDKKRVADSDFPQVVGRGAA